VLASFLFPSAVKFIPGIGALAGGVSMAVLSAASTYALGEVFKKHFESGGSFLDFNPESLKDYYNEQFKKGQKIAKEMNENQEEAELDEKPSSEEGEVARDIVDKLKDLAKLHSEGILTATELEKAKKRLLK